MIVEKFWQQKTVAQCIESLGLTEELAFGRVDLQQLRAEFDGQDQHTLVQAWLTGPEQQRFQQFRFAKRQVEWLGGRLAVKYAAASLLGGLGESGFWQQLQVEAFDNGRPYLVCDHGQPAISISHSGDLAVGMAAGKSRCGVDVQYLTPTISKVEERYAHPDEIALWQRQIGPKKMTKEMFLTLLWSSKEALRKAVDLTPLAGFLELRLRGIAEQPLGGFLLSLTCPRNKEQTELKTFSTIATAGLACSVAVLRHS